MKKHTSGPWKVLPEECDRSYIRIRGTVLGGRYKIANVITPVWYGVPEFEAQETRANAVLIAAAPELLKALKAMLTHMGMDEDEWNKPTFDQARAAIRAAEENT
jgi:hypothetical protein